MKSFATLFVVTGVLAISTTAGAVSFDHLQCFKVRDSLAAKSYSAVLQPSNEAFQLANGCSIKVPAKFYCIDVAKTGVVPIPDNVDAPDGLRAQAYFCYKAKCPQEAPAFSSSDQFGDHEVTAIKTSIVCAPADTDLGGATTTTMPSGDCSDASECPGMDTACQIRNCAGTCGFIFAPSGSAAGNDTAGDCRKNVCNGMGGSVPQLDDTDDPNDGNDCTSDFCVSFAPTFEPKPIDSPCTSNGGTVCDGNGSCKQCNQPSQCPGMDSACSTRTCTAHICGVSFTPNGNDASNNIAGDCQRNVCDGSGNFSTVVDNGDAPVEDGNQCTAEECDSGVPNRFHLTDTPCNQNGGTTCLDGVCE